MDGISEKDMIKLRAILARADESPYEGERDNALRAAASLMAKLSVGPEVLDEVRNSGYRDKPTSFQCNIWNPYALDKIQLLDAIAGIFSCRVVYTPGSQRGSEGLLSRVFGFQRDLDIMWTLFQSLSTQLNTDMYAQEQSSSAFRRSFILSFAGQVETRMKEFYREAIQEEAAKSGKDKCRWRG